MKRSAKQKAADYRRVGVRGLLTKSFVPTAERPDEWCACGHLRSQHADRYAPGHGPCTQRACHCGQFTWVGQL